MIRCTTEIAVALHTSANLLSYEKPLMV